MSVLLLRVLTAIVWISGGIFGLYVLGFYVVTALTRDEKPWFEWNLAAEGMATPTTPVLPSLLALWGHFVGGSTLLLLGPIQFIKSIRKNHTNIHRQVGRLFVLASILTATGGLVFIAVHGTTGGLWMDIGFGSYGAAMLVCAIQTWRTAPAALQQVPQAPQMHKKWSWRLYALSIGSWLYRVEYGMWGGLFGRTYGIELGFTGPFDRFMTFFFWVPNLILSDYLFWKQQRIRQQQQQRQQQRHPQDAHPSEARPKKEVDKVQYVQKNAVASMELLPAWLLGTTLVVLVLVSLFAAMGVWIPGIFGRVGPWMLRRRDMILGNWTGDVCLVAKTTVCVL